MKTSRSHAAAKLFALIGSLSLMAITTLVMPSDDPARAALRSATTEELSTNDRGFTLSPASVDFGNQLIGTTSPARVFSLTNPSTSAAVIREIDIIGSNYADFKLAHDFTLPLTVAPDASAAIEVSFAPSSPWTKGTRNAKVKLRTDDGNQFVTLSGTGATCAGAVSSCDSAGLCADTDGDGFNDIWEDNDYIDLNNNGREDKDDFHFPHRASHIFSSVSKTGTGRGQVFPTVIDSTLPVDDSTIVVSVSNSGNLNEANFTYTINGGAPSSPLPIRPVVDIAGNLRLMFYLNNFVAGDTYMFTVSMGENVKIANREVPNIYVQYDYMDWATPGAACSTDRECANPNDVCHQGFCNHNHAPGDPLFRKVVDQFAAHGITLYIDPVHQPVPHAQVITFSQQGDGTSGATAACAGGDVVAGNIGPGQFAVNFHDIKYRPGSDFAEQPVRKNIYHYTVFSHLSTCLQDVAGDGDCNQCPTDRSSPSGQPVAGPAGTAEDPGNDFMVSMGDRWYVTGLARTPFFRD